jgi:hypothetical protein
MVSGTLLLKGMINVSDNFLKLKKSEKIKMKNGPSDKYWSRRKVTFFILKLSAKRLARFF